MTYQTLLLIMSGAFFVSGVFVGLFLGTFRKPRYQIPPELGDLINSKEYNAFIRKAQAPGDGKAVAMDDFTPEEAEEYERLEKQGWKGFYKKLTAK